MSHEIPASPGVVWDLLVTVAHWPAWGPSVRSVQLDTDRITLGSRGLVQTAVGVRLPFEVTRFDPDRSWSWMVRGVQATDHRVEPTESGCRVSFGVPWAAAPYLGICAVALRRIEHLALQEVRG